MKEEMKDPASVLDKLIDLCGQATLATHPLTNGSESNRSTREMERFDRLKNSIENAWTLAGLDEDAATLEKIAKALDEGKGVTIIGSIGSGKTKRLEAICKALGYHFLSAGELIRMVRECQQKFGEDTGLKMALKTNNVEFSEYRDHALAIDDIGKEPPEVLAYGTRHDYMVEAIEERYKQWADRKWITLFSTQMSPEEIRKRYPAHIADRIGEMTVPVFLARRSRRVSWL